MRKLIKFTVITVYLLIGSDLIAQPSESASDKDHLVVVWTSSDPYVAEKMVFMYTHAAQTAGWFSKVTLIIWGPSAKLTAENRMIQEKLKAMQADGVIIEACIACARSYNVDDDLENLGFDVKGMGKPLTDYLKSDARVMTF
jgi:hypothetical protein